MKANETNQLTSEILEKIGFKKQNHAKYNDKVYYGIFSSDMYGEMLLSINLTHRDWSMEVSRLPKDGHGYASWWLPNPMYVCQLEKIFDLLEIKIKLLTVV